jgi:hypothetical protein
LSPIKPANISIGRSIRWRHRAQRQRISSSRNVLRLILSSHLACGIGFHLPNVSQKTRIRGFLSSSLGKLGSREYKLHSFVKWASVRLDGGQRAALYTTNMATPATNIATVVIATTIHPNRELGWPCISFLSEATIRMATKRNGANNPLMIAVQ